MTRTRETPLDRMLPRLSAVTIGFATLMTSAPAPAETSADRQCAKDQDVRLIEIRFADDSGSLPCRVIYRPEDESDTVGIVSWQGIESLPACEAQANEVIDRLTLEGWICAADDIASDGAGDADVTAVGVVEALPSEGDGGDEALPEEAIAEAQTIANLPPEGSDVPAAETGDSQAIYDIDEPAVFVDNPDVAAPSDDLVALVESNLDQLDTTLDGRLEATVAGYGDLNADDVDDALVLYTYTSPQPAYRQFLAAYMFDGDAYQLTATRPIGGNVTATMNARIETVDRGIVHLSLQAFEPGDPSCCPSGTKYLALTLQELDLVEIDADIPTR